MKEYVVKEGKELRLGFTTEAVQQRQQSGDNYPFNWRNSRTGTF